VVSSTRAQRPIDLRRQQKQAHRDSMVAAAAGLFDSVGWAGTTMEAVAAASGMSVQSVYFAFHSKAGLLRAALERATPSGSRGPLDGDPDTALRQLVEGACRDLEVKAGLVLAAAGAGDGDAADLHRDQETLRSKAAADLVHQLRRRRPLAPGVTARRVGDVVFGLLSPQLYVVMVRDRGWTTTRYAGWAADAIGRALWG
jgi:AcrR family transcriptional regulator